MNPKVEDYKLRMLSSIPYRMFMDLRARWVDAGVPSGIEYLSMPRQRGVMATYSVRRPGNGSLMKEFCPAQFGVWISTQDNEGESDTGTYELEGVSAEGNTLSFSGYSTIAVAPELRRWWEVSESNVIASIEVSSEAFFSALRTAAAYMSKDLAQVGEVVERFTALAGMEWTVKGGLFGQQEMATLNLKAGYGGGLMELELSAHGKCTMGKGYYQAIIHPLAVRELMYLNARADTAGFRKPDRDDRITIQWYVPTPGTPYSYRVLALVKPSHGLWAAQLETFPGMMLPEPRKTTPGIIANVNGHILASSVQKITTKLVQVGYIWNEGGKGGMLTLQSYKCGVTTGPRYEVPADSFAPLDDAFKWKSPEVVAEEESILSPGMAPQRPLVALTVLGRDALARAVKAAAAEQVIVMYSHRDMLQVWVPDRGTPQNPFKAVTQITCYPGFVAASPRYPTAKLMDLYEGMRVDPSGPIWQPHIQV